MIHNKLSGIKAMVFHGFIMKIIHAIILFQQTIVSLYCGVLVIEDLLSVSIGEMVQDNQFRYSNYGYYFLYIIKQISAHITPLVARDDGDL